MEQKGPLELTVNDLGFLKKLKEVIKDSNGVSYYGYIYALTMLAYKFQKTCLITAATASACREDLIELIDNIEQAMNAVCGSVARGVEKELSELLDEDAKKEPNTNI